MDEDQRDLERIPPLSVDLIDHLDKLWPPMTAEFVLSASDEERIAHAGARYLIESLQARMANEDPENVLDP